MKPRLQAWLDETHCAGFELLRHFLARFFDSEGGAAPGEWLKVAIGLFAALLSAGILVLKTYGARYTFDLYALAAGNPPGPLYRQWVRADMLSFVGLAMAITALLTLLVWHSLVPAARDCLALAALPVGARQIFRAKFLALLLVFAAFTLALNLPPAVSFAVVTAGQWQENPSSLANVAANFCATGGACVFIFFSLLALQGLLLNLLPARMFAAVSQAVQAMLIIATLGALPLLSRQPAGAAWWPPVWFLHLWESIVTGSRSAARPAVLAMALPAMLAVVAYLSGYHRYRRLLLEIPRDRAARRTGWGSWLLERWIGDPRQQAAFAFLWKTLVRSRGHRLILLAFAGLALGWIVDGVLDTPRPLLRDQGLYGLAVVLVPLALSMLAVIGLRYVFSLPVSLGANWVFQTADREGRAAWLAAVERFVVWCGMAPVFAAGLPAAAAILGPPRAAAATVLAFLASLVWFEFLFRHWRKMPYTCSYVPGRKPIWFTVARYCLAIPFLPPAGKLIVYCSTGVTPFVALFTFLAALWWSRRTARRNLWSQCALCYEETLEPEVMTLALQNPPETGLQPHLAEPAPELFSGSLVTSRPRLAQAWAEETKWGRPSLLFENLCEDVRFGLRLIRRNPLLSSVVVLTLTAGIGINASIFTVVNGLAFRPHVGRDPETFLRVIPKTRTRNAVRRASYGEYAAWRDQSRSLRQLAAFAHFPAFLGEDNSTGSVGLAVSCNIFQVDGTERPLLGRLLTAEDCHAAAQAPVAVLSETLWRARFASDPHITGRVIELNNRPVTIAGVAPNGVLGWTARTAGWTTPASIWVPYTAAAYFEPMGDPFAEDHLWLSLAGRLAPGYARSDAQAELNTLARQQDRLHPGRSTAIVATDGSWARELELTLSGQQLMLLAFFLGFFNLVLFISCANVATLLVARAAARRREIAVRLSLGAPRLRLLRMLVTESLLLAAVAGALSLYLAWYVPEPLFRLLAGRPPDFPVPPDWRTFACVATVVLLTGVLAGLAPALESLRVNITGSLKGDSGSFGAGRARRLPGLLVSAQVAMSMVLLVGAALFARAEERSLRADPGYLPRRVVIAPLYFPDGTSVHSAAVRLLNIAQRMKTLPGVRSVAFSEGLPLFDRATVDLRPPGRPDASQPVDVFTASPGFFETLGVPLLRGREFEAGEMSSVIVSQSLARAFWPRQDPIGKAVTLPGGKATVVGVARDADPLRFGGSENPVLYRAWRLHPNRNMLSVRFDTGAPAGAAAVRAAIRELDPRMLGMARLMQSWIGQVTEDFWNVVALILLLGLVATLLATAGIYGAVSFAVNRRTKELGIRVALGAQRRDILREVFWTGGKPVLKGLLLGLWLSVATAAGLRQTVSGSPLRLDSANPLLYCGAALLLAAAATLAMLVPARRGARSDPLAALRCE
ncbi:MAG: ABC transporter permease [Acidobacteria bacterium]|nr:ABC transporter permease [Acidobacteriota bacterium]